MLELLVIVVDRANEERAEWEDDIFETDIRAGHDNM